MKLIVLLAVVAWSNAAKLDRTYLPPSHAQTSGGSGNFLETPLSGFDTQRPSSNGFVQNRNNFGQEDNGTGQNGFVQSGEAYGQNGNGFAQGGDDFELGNDGQNGVGQDYESNVNAFGADGNYESQPERPQAAFERNAAILRQTNENDGETYAYSFETENGISAEESGVATNGVEAQGGYSYTGDDGQVYSVRYTAGENGFVPEGDHLPTAPPVPEEIQIALEQNARDEANGVYDDGTYNEGKYDAEDEAITQTGYGSANGVSRNGFEDNLRNRFIENNDSDEDSVVINSLNSQPGFRTRQELESNNQPIGNQESFGLRNQATNSFAAQREYLPPTQSPSRNNVGQVSNGLSNQAFANHQSFGQRNQATNGFAAPVEREYLPPTQASSRNNVAQISNTQGQSSRNQAFGNQQSFGQRNQATSGFVAPVEREYLPPTQASSRIANVPAFNDRGLQLASSGNQAFGSQQSFGQRTQESNSFSTAAVEREYLPPQQSSSRNGNAQDFTNQRFNTQQSFGQRNQAGNGLATGVQREYLPPTQFPADNGNSQGFRQSSSFQKPNGNGFRNQNAVNLRTEAETKVYLPPAAQSSFGVRGSNGLSRPGNSNGLSNRGNGLSSRPEAAAREYLPPTQAGFSSQSNRGQSGVRGQNPAVLNQVNRTGANSITAANREYLPPAESRPANNGFGTRLRQPTFNARDGYQY